MKGKMVIILIFKAFVLTDKRAVLINSLAFMENSCTLLDLKTNQEAQILSLSSNINSANATRLRELGFREGEFVRCLKTPPFGAPHVYLICGSVFSMEAEIAKEIVSKIRK
ncbi:MAG: ferrous iron transport protein A [Oligoflexales bacterium]|nr:ferrous iron transport protein A [Oligoflexales bacterium]